VARGGFGFSAMRSATLSAAAFVGLAAAVLAGATGVAGATAQDDAAGYLSWPRDRAEAVAKSTRARDNAGKVWWDTRGTRTERSSRYDVVATWMTPEVIQATARTLQLREGLSAEATKALVAAADHPGQTIVMIEIDPHEGSGVVPLDRQAYLLPFATGKGIDGAASGVGKRELRDVRVLGGILRRDYAYDRFWMVFPLKNAEGQPLFGPQASEAEVVVRIYDKEARLKFPIPASIRAINESQ
jgi:hypothetical protein